MPQPPDPVEDDETLLVVEEFVVEALGGFPKDRAPNLVAEALTEYHVCGHREVHLWSGPPEGGGALAGVTSLFDIAE